MDLINLYSELQTSPRNQAIYQQLSKYYQNHGLSNESEAFLDLIKIKFYADSTSTDQE